MIQVGKKDKIFVAVLIPVLVFVAFLYYVREPAVKQRAEMKARIAQLPEPSMFPMLERRLKEKVAEAEVELKKTKDEKPPAPKVVANKDDSIAARRETLFDTFRKKGAEIKSVEPIEAASISGDALKATGCRPAPAIVRVSLEAEYPAITGCLKEIEEKKMAVIVEAVEMSVNDKCRWEILLWF